MPTTESVGNVNINYLNTTFGDQFRYISPWVMAQNMLEFAPREYVHDPHHKNLARTKTLIEKSEQGFEVVIWLERDSDHAKTVHLRGYTQIGDYQSPLSIGITKKGAFDSEGIIDGSSERELVNLMYRLMKPDDPNLPID